MSVRVVKPSPEPKAIRFTCRKCLAELEAKAGDGRHVSDPRDGDAYVFVCPCCTDETWIAARMFKAEP